MNRDNRSASDDRSTASTPVSAWFPSTSPSTSTGRSTGSVRVHSDAELDELLGAYALNAVDQDEADEIEAYLRRSPRASAEVSGHLEVAAALGSLAAEQQGAPTHDAPQRLWDAIAGQLPDRPAPARAELQSIGALAGVTSLEQHRGSRRSAAGTARTGRMRTLVSGLALVASVTAITGLSAAVIRQGDTIDGLERQVAAAQAEGPAPDDVVVGNGTGSITRVGVEFALQKVLSAPGTRVVQLTDQAGTRLASIALAADGTGYVFGSTLPALPTGSTYQLWGVSNGVVLSLGVFGQQPAIAPFAASGSYTQLVLTAEQGPGVVASEAKAVAAAQLA